MVFSTDNPANGWDGNFKGQPQPPGAYVWVTAGTTFRGNEILKKGTGSVSPKATDKVEVHYHGTLISGFIFDSSVNRGETITFGLNQVIKGWTEGLQLMKAGDKFKFYIPSEIAYGDSTPGAGIPPGATLIFEVELFKVNP